MKFSDLPHLVFIESACPAFLSNHANGDMYFYTSYSSQFAPIDQRKIIVSSFWIRYLKILAALLRFPCTFQTAYGSAYRLSKIKSVISDGLLTEWLYQQSHIKPASFISVTNLTPHCKVESAQQLIIGSNWYEFGSMSLYKYEALLHAWNEKYPCALYFPHPKEGRDMAKKIFGDRLIESSQTIEPYCIKNGIPSHVIGLGSTAMATLGKIANSEIKVEIVSLDAKHFDGRNVDVVDPYLLKNKNIKLTLVDLSEVIRLILKDSPLVSLVETDLFLAD